MSDNLKALISFPAYRHLVIPLNRVKNLMDIIEEAEIMDIGYQNEIKEIEVITPDTINIKFMSQQKINEGKLALSLKGE